MPISFSDVGLKDNYLCGSIGEYLQRRIVLGSYLSFVSAYFSIYAYEKLQTELDGIRGLRFLFGEPQSVRSLDPNRSESKQFLIDSGRLSLDNVLTQKAVARDCERWIQDSEGEYERVGGGD